MSDRSLFGGKDGNLFGAESYLGENDRANKRVKEMSIDRLSVLPDSLLIHILSFLGVEAAAITSVLGKRWQFIWAEVPVLKFEFYFFEKIKKISDFVAWVHKTLTTRKGNYLERLEFIFDYNECFGSDVNGWLEFALKNKVKQVSLRLRCNSDFYRLPEMMHSNSSFTSLSLGGCILTSERTIEWHSLTCLEISSVELPQLVVENILAGCPVLNCLNLSDCWGFTSLEINSQNLSKLEVQDPSNRQLEPFLLVSAPYLKALDVSLYPLFGRKLHLTNIPSLVRVNLSFDDYSCNLSSEDLMSNMKEFFESIRHVDELRVGFGPLKALAVLVRGGWQLPKSRRRSLETFAFCDDEEHVSGIVGLLESSPYLEELFLDSESNDDDEPWVPPSRVDLGCDLLHLKTVRMYDFGPNIGGEPMLTLARIILKRATVLEKLKISINTSDNIKIGQTLLTYPRSSPKAVILLC